MAMLTTEEVAKRLRFTSLDAVTRLIHSGALVATNISTGPGRATWRIDEDDLRSFLESRRAVPNATATRTRQRALPAVPQLV